jgi:hypothetical protein
VSHGLTNVVYHLTLRLCDGKRLITVCPIPETRKGELIQASFTVKRRFLGRSKFTLTEGALDSDGKEIPFAQFWFFLGDMGE